MSGRFSNLEFTTQSAPQVLRQNTTAADAPHGALYLARADEFCRWGEHEPALRCYTRALQEDRALLPAWVGQVQMLVQLNELHEARMWADKALEMFRDNGELQAAKAQACARLADRKAALACSDGSLRAPGSSPWRWQVRGEVLLATGRPHADECFQRATQDPQAGWFDQIMIAEICLYYRRATNALVFLKRALESEPAHGYTWFLMGQAQVALALAEPASRSYAKCLELRPNYQPALEAVDQLASGGSFWSGIVGRVRRWSRR